MNLQDIDASASPEVQMNENFESIELVSVYGKRHPVTTGLTWGYWGGRWGGTAITAGTLTLTNTADNYLVVLKSTGAISTSTATTNWNNTGLYSRVYKITCAGGVVTAVEDHRAGLYGVHGWEVPITSPTFLTSIVAGSTTMALLNTVATTINFGGAATTMNVGAGAASSLNLNFTTGIALNTSAVTTNQTTVTAFAGATTLLTIGGTGASAVVAIPGTLDWSTTTGALTVAGGVYIAKKLQVVSDFSVNTDKFTVAASSGNTLIAGTLGVTGAVTSNAGGGFISAPTTGTNQAYFRASNTGGDLYIGLDNSIGTAFGGAGNYGTIIYRPAATGLDISRAGTRDLNISTAGVITIPNLAGTGTRTVVADANGVLSAP